MCGRYVIDGDDEEHFFENFGAELTRELFPDGVVSFNIAPTHQIPVIRQSEDSREVASMHWGLIPAWADDRSMASKMINARSETIHEKPSYRSAYKSRRCIVPASGWYEWVTLDGEKGKTPLYFKRDDGKALAFAGLWEEWADKKSGEIVESCTILTQAANHAMEAFHHRMPTVVAQEAQDAWLAQSFTPNQLSSILEASAATGFTSHRVHRDVGKVSENHAGLITPVKKPKGLFD